MIGLVATELLAEHLGVAGDHRQRRIHFVRDTRRQQANGGQLLRLRELLLHIDGVGDVVDDDDAAYCMEVTIEQWSYRDVRCAGLAGRGWKPELVERTNTLLGP